MPFHRFAARLLTPFAASALLALPMAAAAQDGSALRTVAQLCRTDIQTLCGSVKPGGGRIAQCLRDNRTQVSDTCRGAIKEVRQANKAKLPKGAKVMRDIAYGEGEAQRMDVYLPPAPKNAPVIVMMHGGGWATGSKSSAGVVNNKIDHFLPEGFIFVSVETRLLPQADPLQQADDLAHALAAVQEKAESWGGNPQKLVLMGHSAGAHLVSLLSTDPSIAQKAGAKPWLATVALDSAAYDVPALMKGPNVPELYRHAFGKDPAFWDKASPAAPVAGNAAKILPSKMLLVCSSIRDNSCPQADALSARLNGRAEVVKIRLRHMQIDAQLGKPGDYTAQVDAFLASVGVK